MVFFFKQKTAYEMRISDWSSDVCSSDLSDDGPFASGTEEEFNVAMTCLRSNDHAMEDVVVQFKSIEPGQLSDPGPQLRKVLEFKQKLEASRELLFGTFEAEADFAESLRMKLADWVWNHENPSCDDARSEEHTSELQSLMRISYAVFCL